MSVDEENRVVETYVVCEIEEGMHRYFKVLMTANGSYYSERPVIGLRMIPEYEFRRLQDNMRVVI
jgi:hypothetical protein